MSSVEAVARRRADDRTAGHGRRGCDAEERRRRPRARRAPTRTVHAQISSARRRTPWRRAAGALHRPHEEVAEVAPRGVAGDGVAGERAGDDDEQEPLITLEHRGRDEEAALLREAEQAVAASPRSRRFPRCLMANDDQRRQARPAAGRSPACGVRRAALTNSVRTRAITACPPRRRRRPTARRLAEQVQERVLEPLGRHDRLQPQAGADERGGEVGPRPSRSSTTETVALRRDRRRRPASAAEHGCAARSRSSTST